ncbi:L,D-transpeptidase family protein [Blastomonas sp.]|uniref:L,D-transpeptidase family protein n=1 Tax=Blastomonas sp. TaxID=1909299 RepID=UPI00262EDB58|nr:L,D-transpeptidase family protein [Blastomonas sp.]MDM7956989.1 L,D-transpeptidase family protein [Blastomonas sp.]
MGSAPQAQAASWRVDQAQQLQRLIAAAGDDALRVLETSELEIAVRQGPGPALDRVANALAMRLAGMHLLGHSSASQKAGWQIVDTDAQIDLEAGVSQAIATDSLMTFMTALRPAHSDYAALRTAYASESAPDRKAVIGRNMERWRWMPRSLGADHLLINAAFFEARLTRQGKADRTWRVIVGKTSTPTPVFATQITGVNLNPYWNIPASIVREKGGRFSASQGYVYANGRWRQKPGPLNALGQMKLVMPNPYSVYVHDTPSKQLFSKDTRAFSHGCVRIDDAAGFAAVLLEGSKTSDEVASAIKAGQTVTFDLVRPIPIYLAYFTAAPAPDGTITFRPDIYRRDGKIALASNPVEACRA